MGPFGHERPGGLFRQVLRWMLGPLVVIWPAAVLVTYLAAGAIADQTYDRELRDMVRAVGEEARLGFGSGKSAPSLPVLNALRNDPVDRLYVHVLDARGDVIAGDTDLPKPASSDAAPGRRCISARRPSAPWRCESPTPSCRAPTTPRRSWSRWASPRGGAASSWAT